MSARKRPDQRHHCGECQRFVKESTVETYWSMEEGCETGWGECTHCGRVEVFLDRWRVQQ